MLLSELLNPRAVAHQLNATTKQEALAVHLLIAPGINRSAVIKLDQP